MINSNKWFYHQEQKSAHFERFVIKCFIIVYHWYVNLLADAEVSKDVAEGFVGCYLARNLAEVEQHLAHLLAQHIRRQARVYTRKGLLNGP